MSMDVGECRSHTWRAIDSERSQCAKCGEISRTPIVPPSIVRRLRWIKLHSPRETPCAVIPSWPECGPEHYKLQYHNGKAWIDVPIGEAATDTD